MFDSKLDRYQTAIKSHFWYKKRGNRKGFPCIGKIKH